MIRKKIYANFNLLIMTGSEISAAVMAGLFLLSYQIFESQS